MDVGVSRTYVSASAGLEKGTRVDVNIETDVVPTPSMTRCHGWSARLLSLGCLCLDTHNSQLSVHLTGMSKLNTLDDGAEEDDEVDATVRKVIPHTVLGLMLSRERICYLACGGVRPERNVGVCRACVPAPRNLENGTRVSVNIATDGVATPWVTRCHRWSATLLSLGLLVPGYAQFTGVGASHWDHQAQYA
jgi:hypothetical protein